MPISAQIPTPPLPPWVSLSLMLTIVLAISGWLLLAHIQTRQDVLVLIERVNQFHRPVP